MFNYSRNDYIYRLNLLGVMKSNFSIFKKKEREISFYIIDEHNNENIGEAYGYLGQDNELISVVKIYLDAERGKGEGYKAFKEIFDHFSHSSPINKIIGSWHKDPEHAIYEQGMSTNLLIYKKCRALGQSQEQSAMQTPTGKWASRLGFIKCHIISESEDKVEVEFYPDSL